MNHSREGFIRVCGGAERHVAGNHHDSKRFGTQKKPGIRLLRASLCPSGRSKTGGNHGSTSSTRERISLHTKVLSARERWETGNGAPRSREHPARSHQGPGFLSPSQHSRTHLLAKKATQGKRRSWVSTKTFCTKRFGVQLCCKKAPGKRLSCWRAGS